MPLKCLLYCDCLSTACNLSADPLEIDAELLFGIMPMVGVPLLVKVADC